MYYNCLLLVAPLHSYEEKHKKSDSDDVVRPKDKLILNLHEGGQGNFCYS